MSSENRSQWLGWAILLACLISVPVGLLARDHKSEEKPAGETKQWSLLGNKDHILALHLYGQIDDGDETGMFSRTDTAAYVKKKLRKAIKEDHVKAIILRINSPGGTVGMSQEVYDAVQAFRAKGKPVVVSMGDITASGGYYIASAADEIFANPGTLTGSIGVIMHLLNWQETEKKLGLQPDVIKSGLFKDIGSADRSMTKEERDLLQNIIMDSYDQFVSAVAAGRKMDKEQVKKLADGRIYSGRQAAKVKLVDELGSYDDALAWLQTTCRKRFKLSEDLPVDDGSSSLNFLNSLMQSSSYQGTLGSDWNNGLLKGILPSSMNPKFNKLPMWIMQ